MAITVASSSKMNYASGSTTQTITAPTGIQTGDLLICIIAGTSNDAASYSMTGFTLVKKSAAGGESIAMFRKTAVLADESAANYTIGIADSEIVGAVMLRITGWSTNEDFTRATEQSLVTNGVFDTLDLTPTQANSLIIFGVYAVTNFSTVAGYAIATSNPSWTTAQTIAGAFSTGETGVAWAVRPEVTATGDFSFTDSGDSQKGIALVIAPKIDITVTPIVIDATISVQAPTITGGATITPAVIDLTASVQTPTVTTTPAKWVNEDKHSVSFVNVAKS